VPLSGAYVGAAAEQPDLASMSVAQLRGFIKQVGCCISPDSHVELLRGVWHGCGLNPEQ
jgi:hypothetical protein